MLPETESAATAFTFFPPPTFSAETAFTFPLETNSTPSQQPYTRVEKNLTNGQRQSIYEALLQQSANGRLRYGTIGDVANSFCVCPRTVSRIWQEARWQVSQGMVVDLSSKNTNHVRRKRVELVEAAVSQIPLRQRSTVRSLANALGVSKSTLHRRIKEGALRPHTNAIKPVLSSENKRARLKFCLSMVCQSSCSLNPVFQDMFNTIHIDEKWFYINRPTRRYYLIPGEEEPLRACKSKKFITKVMFLAAVARPRFDPVSGREVFSGKIGIFPFTTLEPAQRSSKNRRAGTLETKPVLSVTKAITRKWLIEKLLPAVQAKWPQEQSGPIFIQQDNAKPHIGVDDMDFVQAASATGLDIRLAFQPPNSPDLNVLDLGFFRAIQSLQEQQSLSTIDELVEAVQTSFEKMPSSELNRVFLTMQSSMKEIMLVEGGNNYRIPHMGKERLSRLGKLPIQLECPQSVIDQAQTALEQG